MRTRKKTYGRYLLDYLESYKRKHGDGPVDPNEVADHAMKHGVSPRRPDAKTLLARDFAKIMKKATEKDAEGRTVRTWHAIRETTEVEGTVFQHVWWNTRHEAMPKFMLTSLQQRRQGILRDCLRLKTDRDSYNDHNKYQATLPFPNFDFREDIAESEQSTEYPDSPSDDDDDDGSGVPV
ncbi:MAG: hypothetical protein JNL28_13500 [Planctomycetes bacterium]|nr:hypothetical protein [Planctomycetota bacterium]